jgi:hypothetical protein
MRSFTWWHNRLITALLAVGTALQAVAQATPPTGTAQIVPFRSTTTWSSAAGAAGVTPDKAGAKEKTGTVWLQFVNSDIATVARSLGVMTGRQVLVDTRVEGTLNLQSIQEVSPGVAWEMFSQALSEKNLTILSSQGMYIISPQALTSSATGSDRPAKAGPLNNSAPNDNKREDAKSQPEDFEITVEWAKSPKTTLPNPAGAPMAVRLPDNEPIVVWSLMTQDRTLYHTLSRWAQTANWQLMWEAERDFPIQAQISIEGGFTAAIQLVMNSLASTDYPLQAVMNDSTRVISVIRHQDPYAR